MAGDWWLGIDVGGTKILAAAHDADGAQIAEIRQPTPSVASEIVAVIESTVEALSQTVGATPAGVGVGIPGFVDHQGVIHAAPNAPTLVGLAMADRLSALGNGHVVVDNDANCAALAMSQIDAPLADSVLGIMLGTGIGGGLIWNQGLVRGHRGFAGEVGHMIVDAMGPPCPCGQRGCWEVLASGQGLGRLARAAVDAGSAPELAALVQTLGTTATTTVLDGQLVTDLAARRRPASSSLAMEVHAILEDYTRWLAVGIIGLINVLDPEVVILGGGITADASVFSGTLNQQLAGYPTLAGRTDVVRFSRLGPEAAVVGAAILAGCPARRI